MSSDIITEFRGRGDQVHVYPLSFKEFYEYRNIDFNEAYKEYSLYGGMPLVLKYNTNEEKSNYLKNLFIDVYLKDIIKRNRLLNVNEFNNVIDIIASSIGTYTNSVKLEKTFKSEMNINYSHTLIEKHIEYLVDSFLISVATRYDIKGKKYLKANYKYYFFDLGLRNAKLSFRQFKPIHIMENIIYNELIIRGYNVDVGIVEKNEKNEGKYVRKQLEVDFVVNKNDERIYIQSVYSLSSLEKIKQEIKSLKNIKDSFRKVIIVNDNIKSYRNSDGIQILSLKEFLTSHNCY